jgi:transposase-like protein
VVTADVCRRHGISEAAFYKWKAKFGGLEVTEARRVRTLEEDNAKLQKILAAREVSPARLDLSRFCAAPMITYCAAKGMNHGHRQDG